VGAAVPFLGRRPGCANPASGPRPVPSRSGEKTIQPPQVPAGAQPIDLALPCSEQSQLAGEPIAGSAVESVDAWLLVEYRARWEHDISACPWPDRTRGRLAELARNQRRLRPQIIRRDRGDGDLTVYVVTTAPRRAVYRFMVPDLDAVADVPVERAIAGELEPSGPQTLYLVCTHGRRDRCCAQHGVALYNALANTELDGELWQSSHQGGHRFAATLLYLPRGVHYGRLRAPEAESLVRAHLGGRIHDIARYRGQTRYARAAQTAEAWLREQRDDLAFDGVELVDERRDGDRVVARFRVSDGSSHVVVVVPRTGNVLRKTSCDAADASPASWFYTVRHEAETAGAAAHIPVLP
jgi:hypothetical protein